MADIRDGETVFVKGSAAKPYALKNTGGVYSCGCAAWRNQSIAIETRTCKHLRAHLGDAHEDARLGAPTRAMTVELVQFPARYPGTAAPAPATPKNVPPLLLAHIWSPEIDPTGMWMSEKLDGVRAWWDGKTFWSRLGNEYLAPAWFTAALPPDVVLDGELWIDRKQFQKTVSIVRRQDRNDEWKHVKFIVFDAPQVGGSFEDRKLRVEILFLGKYAYAHEHEQVRDAAHLKAELARVESLGAEGLMLRQPGSAYEVGRSMTLLKLKSFFDDEAEVVGYSNGKGRHKGRVGALEVKLANGKLFSVGTGLSDKERESPPPIGSRVTFRYQELTDDGVPRFPSYVGVRRD